MDFGRLSNLRGVDFRLPDPTPETEARNLQVLCRAPVPLRPLPAVHVGAPVWGQKQWLGKVYPLGTRPKDFLGLYSRQFNTIELNPTHYHLPTPATVLEWRSQTPEGFRFCPKFPQQISHERELAGCQPLTDAFCEAVSRFEDRLGTTFLQLPPHFGPDKLGRLQAFLRALPRGFPICVEFRHPAWFDGHALIRPARDVLEREGSGTVITDTAGRRDVAHLSLTAPRLMVRFVGNQLHPTDYSRADEWAERLAAWLRAGLRELYFIVHQPGDDVAPELISHFIRSLNATGAARLRDWERMDQGTQMSLL